MLRRSRAPLLTCLAGVTCAAACSSGSVEGTTSPDDATTSESADDTALDDSPATSDGASDDSGKRDDVSAVDDTTPTCGVIACDDAKTFYPKIRAAYDGAGAAPQVGDPHDNGGGVYVHASGAGKVQDFDGGALGPVVIAQSDSSEAWASNAHLVRGAIRAKWLEKGGAAALGYPLEDEHAGPGGEVQHFEKGCIAVDGTGGYDVFSACDAPGDLSAVITKIGTLGGGYAPGTQNAIGVQWLPTGDRWSYAGDQKHVSASSMKFVWAMAALAKNDIATVTTPALPTFKDSNNSTAGQLIDLAGGANAVNDFTSKSLGIPVTALSLCHWSFDKTRDGTATCSGAMGGDNFFTPNSVLDFLAHAWKRDVVSGAKGDTLLQFATLSPRTGYGGWVGTQLPPEVQKTMHHKAGWLPPGCCSSDATYNNMNEIAIVHTPRGAYAIALLFAHASDYWGAQQKTLEWSSCVVYHALAKDVADPFSAGCTHP